MLVSHKSLPPTIANDLKRQDISLRERAIERVKKLPQDPEAESLRTVAMAEVDKLTDAKPELTLRQIAKALEGEVKDGDGTPSDSKSLPRTLAVFKYPPSPTLGYWFVSGVESLAIELSSDSWRRIARWARDELAQQMSLPASQY